METTIPMKDNSSILHVKQKPIGSLIVLATSAINRHTVWDWWNVNPKPTEWPKLFFFGTLPDLNNFIMDGGFEFLSLDSVKLLNVDNGIARYCFIFNNKQMKVDTRFNYSSGWSLLESIVDIIKRQTTPGEYIHILGNTDEDFNFDNKDLSLGSKMLQSELKQHYRLCSVG